MSVGFKLRPINDSDHFALRQIYQDAIIYRDNHYYTKAQIEAWSALAWMPGVLDRPLKEGRGWLILQGVDIEAFAVRYPFNRLALIYCLGRSSRQGYATTLINCLEVEARKEGQVRLVTEASFYSYSLFLKLGWDLNDFESIEIGGIPFKRFLMEKKL